MATRELPVSVALAALSASVALSFGAIFASDAYLGPLLVAAVLPHALGWVTRRWTRSAAASAVVAGAGLLLAAVAWTGSLTRLGDQLRAGWTVVRTDARPIPASPSAVLLGAIAVFVVGAVADDLAFRRDGAMSVLAPATVAVIWLRALGTPHGWVPSTVAFGGAAVVFLAVQHQTLLERRRTRIGRSPGATAPRLLAGVAVAGLAATLVASAVAPTLPTSGHPLVSVGSLSSSTGSSSYQTSVAPLVNVGDQLRRGPRHELFTVAVASPDYWRITALDDYSSAGGGQWTLTARGNGAVGQGLASRAPRGALHQRYQIGPLGERWMPAAYEPVTVSRPDTLVVRSSGTLVTDRSSVDGLSYSVDSRLPSTPVTPTQRLGTGAPLPAALRRYLALPSDLPATLRERARQAVGGATLPYDEALALRDYFRSSLFTYDASVTLGDDENAMVTFLATRRGFCVQFASTYAVMARSLGIPARVAVGFTPGTAQGGVYHVTNFEAHAWPEIWLAGLGWTHLFDPTPRTGAPGGAAPLPGEPPAATRSTPTPSTVPAAPTPTPSGGGVAPNPTPVPNRVAVSSPRRSTGLSVLGWAIVIAGLVTLGLLAALGAAVARKARRRARRRAIPDPAEQVAGAWAEALDGFRAAGVGWPRSLTPYEVAEALPVRLDERLAPPLAALAGRYTAARYGELAPSDATVQAAWQDADAVLTALDAALDLRTRLRSRLRVGGPPRQPEPAGWSRRSPSTND
jgi:transglutaminase-like putative cysteine protease